MDDYKKNIEKLSDAVQTANNGVWIVIIMLLIIYIYFEESVQKAQTLRLINIFIVGPYLFKMAFTPGTTSRDKIILTFSGASIILYESYTFIKDYKSHNINLSSSNILNK